MKFQEDLTNFYGIPFGSCVESSHTKFQFSMFNFHELKKTEEAFLSIATQTGYAGFKEVRCSELLNRCLWS